MILFDFKCTSCERTHEALVPSSDYEHECPHCGGAAKRQISAVRCKLDPYSGDFPGETLKWARQHEKAAQEDK